MNLKGKATITTPSGQVVVLNDAEITVDIKVLPLRINADLFLTGHPVERFDRLTADGWKLDLVTWEYVK